MVYIRRSLIQKLYLARYSRFRCWVFQSISESSGFYIIALQESLMQGTAPRAEGDFFIAVVFNALQGYEKQSFRHEVCKSQVTVSLVVNNRVMVHPPGREIGRVFFIFPERIVIFTRFILSYVMDKGRIISGLAIMAGLIVLGIMLPRSVGKFREYDRVVTSVTYYLKN